MSGLQPFDNRLHTYQYIPHNDGGYVWNPYAVSHPQQLAYPLCQYYVYGPPAPANNPQPQCQYYVQYPQGYYAAGPAPAAPLQPAAAHAGNHHYWHGRTAAQVQHDNQVMATKEGAYEAHELTPKDPKPDQMFWCRELDGSWTLRTCFTIENDLRPGRWQVDANRGNLVFIRAPKT